MSNKLEKLKIKVREKIRGSGEFYLFLNLNGRRKAKKVGPEIVALELKEKIEAQIKLGIVTADDLFKKKPRKKTVQPKPEPEDSTFEYYLNLWVSSFMKNTCKSSSQESYNGIRQYHLKQAPFYKMPIGQITELDIEMFLTEKRQTHAKSTCQHIKNLMSNAFGVAKKDRKIAANPCLGITIPKEGKEDVVLDEPYNEGEIQQLLAAFKDSPYHLFVMFLAKSGCRIGEVCGLEWSHIDLDGRKVTICKSITRGKMSTPKNGKSRTIDLPKSLITELRKLKLQTQAKGRWVFQNRKGNFVDSNNFRSRHWNKTLEKVGLRHTRIHDLRHSYASLLVQKTKDLYYVMRQCGHSDIKITINRYTHLLEEENQEFRLVDHLDEVAEA